MFIFDIGLFLILNKSRQAVNKQSKGYQVIRYFSTSSYYTTVLGMLYKKELYRGLQFQQIIANNLAISLNIRIINE